MIRNSILGLAAVLLPLGVVQAEDRLPSVRATVDPSRAFPDLDRATRKAGAFVAPANVLRVVPGLTKEQVYTLLDVPHFTEGLFGVKTWNYILNFYTGEDKASVRCQFQVHFGAHGLVDGVYWREQSCADLVERLSAPKVVVERQVVEKPVAVPVAPVAARFELHFAFDKSAISLGEADTLAAIVARVEADHPAALTIVGMTDTSGTSEYNDALALRRANSVATAIGTELGRRGVALPRLDVSTSRDLAVPTGLGVKEAANRRVVVRFDS